MARDQRTKLNAELAHNYGSARKRTAATPGRSALTTEEQLVDAVEPELEEQEEAAEHEEPQVAAEPKKSLFELPRKEPSRQPLPGSPFGAQAATPQPAAPTKPAPPPPTPGRSSKPK